jgi:hypothetical protein
MHATITGFFKAKQVRADQPFACRRLEATTNTWLAHVPGKSQEWPATKLQVRELQGLDALSFFSLPFGCGEHLMITSTRNVCALDLMVEAQRALNRMKSKASIRKLNKTLSRFVYQQDESEFQAQKDKKYRQQNERRVHATAAPATAQDLGVIAEEEPLDKRSFIPKGLETLKPKGQLMNLAGPSRYAKATQKPSTNAPLPAGTPVRFHITGVH